MQRSTGRLEDAYFPTQNMLGARHIGARACANWYLPIGTLPTTDPMAGVASEDLPCSSY